MLIKPWDSMNLTEQIDYAIGYLLMGIGEGKLRSYVTDLIFLISNDAQDRGFRLGEKAAAQRTSTTQGTFFRPGTTVRLYWPDAPAENGEVVSYEVGSSGGAYWVKIGEHLRYVAEKYVASPAVADTP